MEFAALLADFLTHTVLLSMFHKVARLLRMSPCLCSQCHGVLSSIILLIFVKGSPLSRTQPLSCTRAQTRIYEEHVGAGLIATEVSLPARLHCFEAEACGHKMHTSSKLQLNIIEQPAGLK